jgi:cytochrome P450
MLRSSASTDAETMQSLDPPAHGKIRGLFARSFSPSTLRSFEDRVRELTRNVLHKIADGDIVDLVDKIAVAVPIYVIAEILGVPAKDRTDFQR